MATVVSLTEERIQELMSGWEAIGLSQDEINALIAQLNTTVGSNDAAITEMLNVTMPQLQADLAAGSILVSELNDTTIPDLQAQLSQHDLSLQNLNDVTIPALNTELDNNTTWVLEFETVTVPALNQRLDDAEAAIAAIDVSQLQIDLDAAEAAVTALQGKFPITGPDIAANAIDANHIAADSVTASEIAAGTITAAEIAAGTITANEIAADTITAAEIAADTITTNELAADSVTASKIAAGAVVAGKIAADAVTANEIASDTITANEIASGAITATEIAADTITATEIASGAITVDEIAAGAVTAEKVSSEIIVANEVYGREGYFGSIEVSQLESGSLTAAVALLGSLSIGGITIDPQNGIDINLDSGGEIRFPADGSQASIDAILRTDDLTVNGGLAVNGITNYLNGKMYLSAGVADPVQQIAIDYTYKYVNARFNNTANTAQASRGLAVDTNGRYGFIHVLPTNSEKKFMIYDQTTLNEYASVHSDDADLNMVSVMFAGSAYYVLGKRWNITDGQYEYRIHRYDMDGVLIDGRFINDPNGNRLVGDAPYLDGAIALDPSGTSLWVAITQANGRYRFYNYGLLGSNPSDYLMCPVASNAQYLSGSFYVGTADFSEGVKRFVVGGIAYDVHGVFVFDASSTGAQGRQAEYKPLESWDSARPNGLLWDGTKFIAMYSDSLGHFLTNLGTHGDTTVYAQYTWYDNNAAGGNKESAPSPIASRLIPRRAWPWFRIPAPPSSGSGDDDANAVRLYMDTDSTTKLRTTVLGGQLANLTVQALAGTGSAPPATSTFTTSTSTGEIAASNGLAYIKGTGEGRMGPISWNALGITKNAVKLKETTSNQNIGTGWTQVTMDEVEYNLGGDSLGVATNEVSILEDGLYELKGMVYFGNGNAGRRAQRITINGSGTILATSETQALANAASNMPMATEVFLVAGDDVQLWAIQSGQASLALASTFAPTYLTVRRIG